MPSSCRLAAPPVDGRPRSPFQRTTTHSIAVPLLPTSWLLVACLHPLTACWHPLATYPPFPACVTQELQLVRTTHLSMRAHLVLVDDLNMHGPTLYTAPRVEFMLTTILSTKRAIATGVRFDDTMTHAQIDYKTREQRRCARLMPIKKISIAGHQRRH